MNLTCPSCFARFALDAALNDTDARHAISQALLLPSQLGPLTLRYLGCFNPPKRAASWGRINRLLTELNSAIEQQTINRHGRNWQVSHSNWHAALTQLLDRKDSGKLSLPLDDHNYLYAIAVDQADKTEASNEKTTEAHHRQRTPTSPGIDHAQALINSPEYQQKMKEQLGLD